MVGKGEAYCKDKLNEHHKPEHVGDSILHLHSEDQKQLHHEPEGKRAIATRRRTSLHEGAPSCAAWAVQS